MLIGHWLKMKSVMGASNALEELAKLMPSSAHKLLQDGKIIEFALKELKLGDQVIVKPGEKVPVDGKVITGSTSIDESMLTGESEPVFKKTGNEVIGGSMNGDGSINVEIKKIGKDSFLAQVINLVEAAQASKSKTQDLANRFALWLTLLSLTGAFITFSVWLGLTHQGLNFAPERSVTV